MSARHELSLAIADLLIELESPLSPAGLGLDARLGPFYGAPEPPARRLRLRWEESEAPAAPGELIYDPGSIWRMYRADDQYYAAIAYHPEQGRPGPDAVLRANPAWDDLTLTERRRPGSPWQSLLTIGAGELLVRTALLFTGGLVFHASGLDDNGRGIVFVGHSGAGKSTQAMLWTEAPGVIAMNDDRIAVRATEAGVTCYGTPWGGTADIARNHQAPLHALILIEQAPDNEIQPLSPAAATPLLLVRTFLPYWDQALMRRAFANLEALLARVPVYRLRCRPEPAVLPLVRSVL